MAYLAFRGCGAVNAVSGLHGRVSRHLFKSVFPRWPVKEVPVGFVTNGVHMPSWDSEFADTLWTAACGKHRWKGNLKTNEADMYALPDDTLWNFRNESRRALVKYVRQRFDRQTSLSGHPAEITERAKYLLHPDRLTLGFARRFVSYKRTNLLLQDPERFYRLLTHPRYPVQLVLAGKAPPFDEGAKMLIRQWNQFIQQYNLYEQVVFLSDYDMYMAEHLVQGVDVWINTPRRPWEACGTSGMKVLVNGGLNLSELDGWWAEAYMPEVGWALGDSLEHAEDAGWDAREATALYELLEQKLVPEFYNRDEKNIPVQWVEKMRTSMSALTPRFSANRMVREYTEHYYLPAAAAFIKREENSGAVADKILNAQSLLKNSWHGIKFGEVQVEPVPGGYSFHAPVYFDAAIQDLVSVELFANGINGSEPEKYCMELLSTRGNEHIYKTTIVSKRPAGDYTARIIPAYENISIPLEDSHILWQH
jgi:starch phosphorylase